MSTLTLDENSAETTGPSPADQMCERLFGAAMGMADLVSVYLGDRLGLYAALHAAGEADAQALAQRAGVNERYAREWLAHQAATGIVEVVEASTDDARRTYRLPGVFVPVFLDKDDLVHVVPLAVTMVSAVRLIDPIAQAFQGGGGVPWSAYGREGIEAQEGFNRAAFAHLLGGEWFPAIPDLHSALLRPGARLLDVACGAARSSVAIARAYPLVTIDAVDVDPVSIDLARRNVEEAGLTPRINVKLADGAGIDGTYDAATIFEAVHDLSDPIGVLRATHRALKPGGILLIADENVGDEFTAPAENLDAFYYAASMLVCLPTAMADVPSAATGTVMRPSTLQRYATEAGFGAIEPIAIDYPMFRFYCLRK